MFQITQILESHTPIFTKINKENPRLELELLLIFVLKKDRAFIMSHGEYELSETEFKLFEEVLAKRLDGTPLAYITHEKAFYGLDFYVDENVLVPRPETEIMVDEALKLIKVDEHTTIIDLGTGSGCIPISIGKNTNQDIDIYAIDISKEALKIAQKNAKNNNIKINFLEGNLLEAIINSKFKIQNSKLIITANLPYLTKEQIKNSPSIQKEPLLALDGGKDGMEYYIELFKQVQAIESDITILAEIDHSQVEVFKRDCLDILPKAKLKVIKDYGGYERIVQVSHL